MTLLRFSAPCILLAGCAGPGMVRIPSADPTPPAAALEVAAPDDTLRLAIGGETRLMELREVDSLVLTGTAQDEGGIKELTLQGNALVTCRDPATGAAVTRSTGFLRRHVPGSAGDGLAPSRRDSRFVLRGADIARLCPGGRLESAVGQARVQAANYSGGAAATPHLEFRVALSAVGAAAIPMPAVAAGAEGPARAPSSPATASVATGFAPEPGAGGSGGAPEPPAPRMCPRSAAPARGADGRARDPGPECLDAPVPSMSPPAGSVPSARVPRGTHAAQALRPQIHRI